MSASAGAASGAAGCSTTGAVRTGLLVIDPLRGDTELHPARLLGPMKARST